MKLFGVAESEPPVPPDGRAEKLRITARPRVSPGMPGIEQHDGKVDGLSPALVEVYPRGRGGVGQNGGRGRTVRERMDFPTRRALE